MPQYNSSYSGLQVDKSVRKGVNRRIAAIAKIGDLSDDLVISAGNVDVFLPFPIVLNALKLTEFIAVTNGVQYTGSETAEFTFNGVATVGCNANNTIIHFKLAINGVVKDETESAVKIATLTDLSTINAASFITLNTNDIVKVYAKADKACTIQAYHTQLTLAEV
jgi:hypothetical protein